jgi:tetratricopeptide (TPR) repeat protein
VNARTLFQEGVKAIREQKDLALGRKYLLRSLTTDPNNDMAWLWLTHTVAEPEKRLEYVERALRINPNNQHALALKSRLEALVPAPVEEVKSQPVRRDVIQPLAPKTISDPLTMQEKTRIAFLMEQGDTLLAANALEDAIEQWVNVLKIRVDHPEALRNAVGNLWQLNYRTDARELVQRALDAGTRVPSIYLTAIDIAEREQNYADAETLRERIATLPDADDQLIVTVTDHYIKQHQVDRAFTFLERALEAHPDSQALLIKIGDLNEEIGRSKQATAFYEQAARLGTTTKAGREADKRLLSYVPVLTDRERGSLGLAAREALGIAALLLLMALQDAGLSLAGLGIRRWIGVFMGLIGSYLLVTATSSPQQRPFAAWMGGTVPPEKEEEPPSPFELYTKPKAAPGSAVQEPTHLPIIPPALRYTLGIAGFVLVVLAFMLVMHQAIELVINDPPPYLPWSDSY